MKKLMSATLICLAMLSLAGQISAKTVIPPEPIVPIQPLLKSGNWLISYYQGPNEIKVSSTSSICVNNNNTWHIAGPILIPIPGSGGWSVDSNSVTLYGSVAEVVQGAAFTAIGQLIGDSLFTGRYVNFDILENWPNGVSGSFKAVFQGAACPLVAPVTQ